MNTYQNYLKSLQWSLLKKQALQNAYNRCQVCNSEYHLNVHHRVYPQVLGTESVSDLIVLCRRCHDIFHTQSPKHWKDSKKSNVIEGKISATKKRYHLWTAKNYSSKIIALCNPSHIKEQSEIFELTGGEKLCKTCELHMKLSK